MNKLTLTTSLFLTLTILTGCGGDVDPNEDPLDTASGMGSNSCQQECNKLSKDVSKYEDSMLSDAGCEKKEYDGELTDGQATGLLASGTSYFCPNASATNKLAEAVSDKSRKHKKALEAYNASCPCMIQLYACHICANVGPGGLCLPEFMTKEECAQKGGTVDVE
jgi:hypothetical protein